ncbi:MAG: PPE domain-containing protein [Mycobacterium sp.]|nr:MAG: PPE domain-containing protein [Mycobacterium sp.]
MDFGSYPPEVNSGRMYAGAGSGPFLAAAEAWAALAAGLQAVANSYQSAVSALTAGPWLGPSSESMSAAAASYVLWLRVTAAQAEETSAQAKAAAAAYQAAFSATVPPPMVAANRSLLMTLVATNVFGINTQAIAATEAQYAEMWAQDAAAMYGYAASSAAATALTPFNPPPPTTNPDSLANQAAAEAIGVVPNTVQQAFTAVPSALQSAAAPAAAADDPLFLLSLLADLSALTFGVSAGIATLGVGVPAGVLGVVNLPVAVYSTLVGLHSDEILSDLDNVEPFPGSEIAPVEPLPAGAVPPPRLSAGLGEANAVGALSVPPAWTIATPAVRPVAYTLPALTGASGTQLNVTAAPAASSGSTPAQMALAGMAGGAMAGAVGTGRRGGSQGKKAQAPARARTAATAGDDAAPGENGEAPSDKPRAVVTGVAAELREFSKLRDEGILTDEEYTEQKNRLLGR